jgi:hypothetical protein
LGGGRMGGLGEDHVAGLGADRVGHVGHDHLGVGRRYYGGGSYYDDGLDCPYYQSYAWPYTCTY